MSYDPHRRLAALILAGEWQATAMQAAVQSALKCRVSRAQALVAAVLGEWSMPYPPAEAALAVILRAHCEIARKTLPLSTVPAVSVPLPPFAGLDLPTLDSPQALAAWLEIEPGTLAWLADADGRLTRAGRRGHYSQTWLRKRSGGLRLVEAPLARLKHVQRRILRGVLDPVPAHPDAFGFVRGRSCQQGAARHAGEQVVICCDLADFFPSVPASRVHALFRCLGYRTSVARVLTGLVTTRSPADCIDALAAAQRPYFRAAHLPQGAPTSPSLANLAAWQMDRRLAALARRLGAAYSRYADDLAFSGDRGLAFDGGAPLLEQIAKIVRDCGFRLNPAKTRVMKQGQRQSVTGLVVNRHINLRRAEIDRLKAILTNCVRHGPQGQNRDGHPAFRAHLTGRVTWVETVNPARGRRLRALLDQIHWPG